MHDAPKPWGRNDNYDTVEMAQPGPTEEGTAVQPKQGKEGTAA